MLRHPVIGLNMSMDLIDKYEKFDFLVPVSYVDAVIGAGGMPICIPPYPDIGMLDRFTSILDGFLFIGGDDYLPEHYGGYPQPESELMPERRDRFDLMLAKWILQETAMPVLGVCGGHQLISIAEGGALVQDIRMEWNASAGEQPLLHSGRERNDNDKNQFRHPVSQEKDSLIARVTKASPDDALMTNSFHHQAVHPRSVGHSLRPTAWSTDGVIEAIEPSNDSPWAQSGRFVLGVQWHPERMLDEEPHRNIFRALIEAARRK